MASSLGGPLLFYHIQNDLCESSLHPNAALIRPSNPPRISFGDVIAAFPLAGNGAAGAFHFRFQVTHEKGVCFADLFNPSLDAAVPTVGGNVIAKVLRLATLTTAGGAAAARGGAWLKPRENVLRAPLPATISLPPSLDQDNQQRRGGNGLVSGSGASSSTPTPTPTSIRVSAATSPQTQQPLSSRALAQVAAALAMPTMTSLVHVVPKEIDGDPYIRDDGLSVDIYASMKVVDARGMRPVKSVADVVIDAHAVTPPAFVDEDLAGKSAFVQAAVMARRGEAARRLDTLKAEAEAAAAEKAAEENERNLARNVHGERLKEWSAEMGGALRPMRVLLASLHTVLWEGARWEPVNMGKLIVTSRVKLSYMKAVTVVHPDKAAGLGAEKAFIAEVIFTKLEEAWRHFQETELN